MIVVGSFFKQPSRPQILNLNLEKKIDYFVFKGHAFSEKYVPGHNS